MRKIIPMTLCLGVMLLSPIVLGAATSYYSKTTVYFNVPSDATFSIAMPDDFTDLVAITGTNEGGATATDFISFNFTATTDATLIEPYQVGAVATTQDHVNLVPIYRIDNTGNVNMKFEIKFDSALPSGVTIYGNATEGATETGTLTAIATNYVTMEAGMDNTKYLNITLFGNTSSAASGETSRTLYIKSTAV